MVRKEYMVEMATDPVCGMQVKVEGAKWVTEDGGRWWYFCSEGCRKKFEADPGRYDGTRPASATAAGGLVGIGGSPAKNGGCCGGAGSAAIAEEVVSGLGAGGYTCPMHPEVVSEKMGACPKCGMGLDAVAPAP